MAILIYMASRQRQIAKAILKADEDILLIPQTRNLVANRRDYAEPSDILSRIKRVEAKLNGTDWIKLDEIDITKISTPISTETDITNNFSNEEGNCFFDIIRKSLMIYSGTIIDVTGGLALWLNTWPTQITDLSSTVDMSIDPSTTTHGIPIELHDTWALGVCIDYKQNRQKPIALNTREQNFEFYLQKDVETLQHGNLDREVTGDLPPASQRWNNGNDL